MHEEGLFPAQGALHRLPQEERRERGLSLVREIFLAAESAAVRDELGLDGLGRDAQHRRRLVAVVPDPLASGVDLELAVRKGYGKRRLRLEKRVLHPLRLEDLVDHVGG
jgi:hypothetical protein